MYNKINCLLYWDWDGILFFMKKKKNKLSVKDILEFFKREQNIKKIDLNTSLLDANIIDSFGLIELISFLEKKGGKKIDLSKLNKENFGSINKMVKFLNNY